MEGWNIIGDEVPTTNKIDYCYSLLYGMLDNVINRLQQIQNIAAHILTKTLYYIYFKIVTW